MKSMKVAISVPDPVFEAGEHLARQLKISRSQLYSDALATYLNSRGAAAVTAQLNAVYAATASGLDESIAVAQERSLSHETW
jgi:metal-responsive CopG/Arc/MetJ family transcriptional regulator